MIQFKDIPKNNGQFPLEAIAEQYGISQTRAQMIPGRFYSFKTKSPVPALSQEIVRSLSGKNYYDLNPTGLLLFHDNWKEVALVLNLSIIPPRATAKLLEAYWQFSMLNGLANLFDKDGKLLPLDQRRLIDQRFYLITPSALSTILGVNNLNYAINKYDIDLILEARLIDWDNFGQLINPSASTYGLFPDPINLVKVWEDFLTNTLT